MNASPSIANLLRRRATVYRADRAVNADGETTLTWRTIARDVPCVLEFPADHLDTASTTARAYLVPECDLRGEDAAAYADPDAERGTPGDRIEVDGLTWSVRSTRVEKGPRAAVRVATLAAVWGGKP